MSDKKLTACRYPSASAFSPLPSPPLCRARGQDERQTGNGAAPQMPLGLSVHDSEDYLGACRSTASTAFDQSFC